MVKRKHYLDICHFDNCKFDIWYSLYFHICMLPWSFVIFFLLLSLWHLSLWPLSLWNLSHICHFDICHLGICPFVNTWLFYIPSLYHFDICHFDIFHFDNCHFVILTYVTMTSVTLWWLLFYKLHLMILKSFEKTLCSYN